MCSSDLYVLFFFMFLVSSCIPNGKNSKNQTNKTPELCQILDDASIFSPVAQSRPKPSGRIMYIVSFYVCLCGIVPPFQFQSPERIFTPLSSLPPPLTRSEEHTSELQSLTKIVCRLLLEKKKIQPIRAISITT